ncbi:MAG: CAP domain-containing protein [Actinomycetota bacterium]
MAAGRRTAQRWPRYIAVIGALTTMGLVGPGMPGTAAAAAPIVGSAVTPSGNGSWQVADDGGVSVIGDAPHLGHMRGTPLVQPISGMAVTPSGNGYWLVASDGGIFSYGDAKFSGSTGGMRLNRPIVGMASSPTGHGYWLVASDGGIFSYGDAKFYGSTGSIRLNRPIVGMASSPTGHGYWLVASDGGLFGFGDAPFYGSTGSLSLNKPIVGMAPARDGRGYLLVGADGGAFSFGTVAFYGSAAGACQDTPAVSVATSRGASGYWITFSDARSYALTPSTAAPTCGPSGSSRADIAVRDYFDRLNAERAARGRAPLAWDGGLATYATDWSRTMAASGFKHSNLGSLLQTGRFGLVGENIASGRGAGLTAGTLHGAWMRSESHRVNMLSPAWDLVGIGVYCMTDGTMFATTSFGRTMAAGPSPPAGPTPAVDPVARGDQGTASC